MRVGRKVLLQSLLKEPEALVLGVKISAEETDSAIFIMDLGAFSVVFDLDYQIGMRFGLLGEGLQRFGGVFYWSAHHWLPGHVQQGVAFAGRHRNAIAEYLLLKVLDYCAVVAFQRAYVFEERLLHRFATQTNP